jgi:FkbM family methyltransferase
MATRHDRRQVVSKVVRALIQRYQHRLSHRHLADQMPQVAVFAFDSMGLAINLFGRIEREELEVLIDWLAAQNKLTGACVDVGANIGNHALFFAGYFSQVFAFEPVPRTFKLLEMNAATAGNVQCFNLGLSNVAADVWVMEPTSNSGAAKILAEQPLAGPRAAVPTKIVPLDSVDEIGRSTVGLMKIDVEGHELQVLQGAARIIARG